MAQRTEAICDGKTIGIESIFTVINGKQINIPDKLNWLREKSRHNELFCPCGCGANLILVAGDKNLREQHFRIKDSETELECTAVTEGKTSIESKIVLKCWLDDKLATGDVDTRVPINAVDNTDRKYEFSFLSMNKKIAVSYFRDRANITDEKLDVLDMNSQDIKLIYITDIMNGGVEGQFPEWLMKIQGRQGFCLLLSIDGVDYEKARLEAVLYDQDIDGLWCEIPVTDGMLSEYDFDEYNNLILRGELLDSMYDRAWYEFRKKQDREHDRRIRQQEEAEAERQRRQEEAEAERKRKQEEQQRLKEEYERKQREYQEEQKRLREAAEAEKLKAAEEFARNMAAGFEQQETQIKDENGVRWIKCEFCGKIAPVKEFSSYGGPNHINLGTCVECSRNNPEAAVEITIPQRTKQRYDPNICPECGSRLIERNGRNGRFMGCSGYPRCRYTRSIR
jgi:DNA-directed RNA polymerase subunit RPC12/RpoP